MMGTHTNDFAEDSVQSRHEEVLKHYRDFLVKYGQTLKFDHPIFQPHAPWQWQSYCTPIYYEQERFFVLALWLLESLLQHDFEQAAAYFEELFHQFPSLNKLEESLEEVFIPRVKKVLTGFYGYFAQLEVASEEDLIDVFQHNVVDRPEQPVMSAEDLWPQGWKYRAQILDELIHLGWKQQDEQIKNKWSDYQKSLADVLAVLDELLFGDITNLKKRLSRPILFNNHLLSELRQLKIFAHPQGRWRKLYDFLQRLGVQTDDQIRGLQHSLEQRKAYVLGQFQYYHHQLRKQLTFLPALSQLNELKHKVSEHDRQQARRWRWWHVFCGWLLGIEKKRLIIHWLETERRLQTVEEAIAHNQPLITDWQATLHQVNQLCLSSDYGFSMKRSAEIEQFMHEYAQRSAADLAVDTSSSLSLEREPMQAESSTSVPHFLAEINEFLDKPFATELFSFILEEIKVHTQTLLTAICPPTGCTASGINSNIWLDHLKQTIADKIKQQIKKDQLNKALWQHLEKYAFAQIQWAHKELIERLHVVDEYKTMLKTPLLPTDDLPHWQARCCIDLPQWVVEHPQAQEKFEEYYQAQAQALAANLEATPHTQPMPGMQACLRELFVAAHEPLQKSVEFFLQQDRQTTLGSLEKGMNYWVRQEIAVFNQWFQALWPLLDTLLWEKEKKNKADPHQHFLEDVRIAHLVKQRQEFFTRSNNWLKAWRSLQACQHQVGYVSQVSFDTALNTIHQIQEQLSCLPILLDQLHTWKQQTTAWKTQHQATFHRIKQLKLTKQSRPDTFEEGWALYERLHQDFSKIAQPVRLTCLTHIQFQVAMQDSVSSASLAMDSSTFRPTLQDKLLDGLQKKWLLLPGHFLFFQCGSNREQGDLWYLMGLDNDGKLIRYYQPFSKKHFRAETESPDHPWVSSQQLTVLKKSLVPAKLLKDGYATINHYYGREVDGFALSQALSHQLNLPCFTWNFTPSTGFVPELAFALDQLGARCYQTWYCQAYQPVLNYYRTFQSVQRPNALSQIFRGFTHPLRPYAPTYQEQDDHPDLYPRDIFNTKIEVSYHITMFILKDVILQRMHAEQPGRTENRHYDFFDISTRMAKKLGVGPFALAQGSIADQAYTFEIADRASPEEIDRWLTQRTGQERIDLTALKSAGDYPVFMQEFRQLLQYLPELCARFWEESVVLVAMAEEEVEKMLVAYRAYVVNPQAIENLKFAPYQEVLAGFLVARMRQQPFYLWQRERGAEQLTLVHHFFSSTQAEGAPHNTFYPLHILMDAAQPETQFYFLLPLSPEQEAKFKHRQDVWQMMCTITDQEQLAIPEVKFQPHQRYPRLLAYEAWHAEQFGVSKKLSLKLCERFTIKDYDHCLTEDTYQLILYGIQYNFTLVQRVSLYRQPDLFAWIREAQADPVLNEMVANMRSLERIYRLRHHPDRLDASLAEPMKAIHHENGCQILRLRRCPDEPSNGPYYDKLTLKDEAILTWFRDFPIETNQAYLDIPEGESRLFDRLFYRNDARNVCMELRFNTPEQKEAFLTVFSDIYGKHDQHSHNGWHVKPLGDDWKQVFEADWARQVMTFWYGAQPRQESELTLPDMEMTSRLEDEETDQLAELSGQPLTRFDFTKKITVKRESVDIMFDMINRTLKDPDVMAFFILWFTVRDEPSYNLKWNSQQNDLASIREFMSVQQAFVNIEAETEILRQEKEQERAEKEAFRQEKERIRAEKEAFRQEKEQIRAEKEAFRQEKERIRAEKEQERAEKERIRAEKEAFRQEKEQIRAETETLRQEFAASKKDAKIVELERQLAEQQSQSVRVASTSPVISRSSSALFTRASSAANADAISVEEVEIAASASAPCPGAP